MNHVPVLLEEVLRTLGDLGGKTIVDCTFGAGGYSRAFLAAGANVIAFDRDSSVMPAAEKFASEYGPERFLFINAPFSEIGNLIRPPTGPQPRAPTPPKGGVVKCSPGAARMSAELLPPWGESENASLVSAQHFPDAGQVDAIVFDLGVSSMQIDTAARGFSFRSDGPLDMRMGILPPLGGECHREAMTRGGSVSADSKASPRPAMRGPPLQGRGELTAAELIENSSAKELTEILREYGDIKNARGLAQKIIARRPQTTLELKELIGNPRDIAPVFQALRIAVNDEMGELERALDAVPALLSPGGACICVTFHSLEDRLVKNIFREWTEVKGDPRLPEPTECRGGVCPPADGRADRAPTKFQLLKTMKPTESELEINPRARSAHLRAVIKL